MTKKHLGLAIGLLVWVGLPALGAHILFGPSSVVKSIRGNGQVHHEIASIDQGSLGSMRYKTLLRETKLYVHQHPDADPAIIAGKALAPKDFLNDELKTHNANFRVREVMGLKVELYDVL